MSTFVDIGNIVAKYDIKSGVIRLTSTEKGNPLKENGIAFNVYPGNERYDILRDMIEDSSKKPLKEAENKVPRIVHISDKYRSKDPALVPLGINENKQVVYWDTKKHAVLSVCLGNSASNTMQLVLDHVKKHKNTKALYMRTFSSMDSIANPWDENIENYTAREQKEFIDKVSKIIKNRASYLKEMNLKNLDQEIAAGDFDRVFVVLNDHSSGHYFPVIQDMAEKAHSLGVYLAFVNTETKEEEGICNTYPVLDLDSSSSSHKGSVFIADSLEKNHIKQLDGSTDYENLKLKSLEKIQIFLVSSNVKKEDPRVEKFLNLRDYNDATAVYKSAMRHLLSSVFSLLDIVQEKEAESKCDFIDWKNEENALLCSATGIDALKNLCVVVEYMTTDEEPENEIARSLDQELRKKNSMMSHALQELQKQLKDYKSLA